MKEISKTNLKAALYESLSCICVEHDFSLKRAHSRFVRNRGEVKDFFQLVFLDGKPGYCIQPNVGVRMEHVESIFHQTSGFERKYQQGTATMGNSVGAFINGDARSCEFPLESMQDVGRVAEEILRVLREFALPYFERWGSLTAIDAELNTNPGARTPHRALAWFQCSTGIIVAKLVGREDFEQLAEIYMDVMTRDNKGFYLGRFQLLLKSLESIEMGNPNATSE